MTVRPALSRAAVQFVEKHPNEVSGIVANALEAAALEAAAVDTAAAGAGLVPLKDPVLPEALRRLVVARSSDSHEGRVLSISETAELLQVYAGDGLCVDRVEAAARVARDAPGRARSCRADCGRG